MPSPVEVSDSVRSLFGIAREALNCVPGPSALEFREELEELADLIGVDRPAVASNAGVAQSAEQDFRKVEAVGSIPIPSSKGLSMQERHIFSQIVTKRVAVDNNLKIVSTAKSELLALTSEFEIKKKTLENKIRTYKEEAALEEQQTVLLEQQLRETMINAVIENVKVLVEKAPEPEPEVIDLGRAE